MNTWQGLFHPLVVEWFTAKFGGPTEPQLKAWPHIAAGRNTLIAAPTGSGKTFSAFLICLDRLLRQALRHELPDGIDVLYLSPLKALGNDIERNLQSPLDELRALAQQQGLGELPIRVAVRTGDTSASERQSMLKKPPHVLVTTPESLYLLLTSDKGRERLRTVRTVIVDEIHALARDKRGSHLALSLERLNRLCETPPLRIGLSATQKPIEEIGRFLVGNASDNSGPPTCTIIDGGHARTLDLAVETPPSELAAVCSMDQWGEVYTRLSELILSHRSTLVFVNTRRLAERVSHHLTELLGEDGVASHHGSLSKEIRQDAEQRLKAGQLKAIVATASLEMGIDIGYIDLVCQVGSPRSISTFLQRVGRSGHSLGKTPKGRLFPLTRDELLECMSLVRSVRDGILDQIEIPQAPLDILAQQIVASVAAEEELDEDALFDCLCGSYPFRELARSDYDAVLHLLAEGVKPGSKSATYLHRDRIHRKLRARKGAKLAAVMNGGAIPERGEYRVLTEGEGTFVGSVDEDFAIDSSAGDVFLLGGTSWRIQAVRVGDVIVQDAQGAPPTIPFWFGEAPGRTMELSQEISRLRRDLAERVLAGETGAGELDAATARWLHDACGADPWGASQALRYVAAQQAALGVVPTGDQIVFERFFDESGGMQLVIHAPLGARVNRAWGLALRKRFCRSFDFELQAAADDDGVLLSLSPQHSFPIEQLFSMLGPHNGRELLEQAVLVAPMFQVRWRWNATRSLAVLRRRGDKRVPPHLQKFRAEDLLAAAFPETVGCLENHHGDVVIPDHPLVRQTMHDCLTEAMDVTRWLGVLTAVKEGRIQLLARDTREPSPFCHELLNANPYAFLDGAPLEERRTRAVQTRRTLNVEDFRDLARHDPAAITQVSQEAWPTVRDAEELHDALLNLCVLHEYELGDWQGWFVALVQQRRAAKARLADGTVFCFAAERWPIIRAAYPQATCEPPLQLPPELDQEMEAHRAWVELARGRIAHSGPISAEALAALLSLETSSIAAALEALEGEGLVLRGQFTPAAWERGDAGRNSEWCERRLLARIHRLTLAGLRKAIAPVEPDDYLHFLARHHGLVGDARRTGPGGVRETLQQLEGFELAAGAWERFVLAPRLPDYDPQWLDELFLNGELMWGRLQPPQRGEDAGPSMAMLTRTVPISIVFREHLACVLPWSRSDALASARPAAHDVFQLLLARGALFLQELRTRAGLLPTQLEEALRELAALGLVTSDTFAAVRTLTREKQKSRRDRAPRNLHAGAGRWSVFPGPLDETPRAVQVQRWCHLLLRRYGVVFRDLLARESAAPPWWELVSVFRKMELRGEVRGGRFIAGVAGEQYGLESTITQLREARQQRQDAAQSSDAWCVVSAVDPLNLLGIINDQSRVTANPRTSLVLQAGRCVAIKQAGQVEFLTPLPGSLQYAMRRALQVGRREAERDPASAVPGVRARASRTDR